MIRSVTRSKRVSRVSVVQFDEETAYRRHAAEYSFNRESLELPDDEAFLPRIESPPIQVGYEESSHVLPIVDPQRNHRTTSGACGKSRS